MGAPKNQNQSKASSSNPFSADKQEEEIEEMAAAVQASEVFREKAREELERVLKDKSLERPRRRYSDQFKPGSLDRLSKELEKNRKARLVYRFAEENGDLPAISEQWKDVILAAFAEAVSLKELDPQELYEELSLAHAGISKEELGIE